MTTTEERLRDALHAQADRVRDERLRPFPEIAPGRAAGRRTARRSAAWRPWLIPAAAAASVVLVIGLVMVVTGGPQKPFSPNRTSSAAGRAGASLPKYFMDVEGSIPPGLSLVVRSTWTGAKIASAQAPVVRGWTFNFDGVAAAPDDRTFYAAFDAVRTGQGERAGQIWIYRMSLSSSGSAASLTPVKGGEIPGDAGLSTGASMAVSPDGAKLALTADTTEQLNNTEGWAGKIIVVDLATGARSLWQGGVYGSGKTFTIPDISWTHDGRSLVYVARRCNFPASSNSCAGSSFGQYTYLDTQVRSLSVGTGGGPLDHSLMLLKQSARYPVIAGAIAGPDGSDLTVFVLSGRLTKSGWSQVAIEHVSAPGGLLLGVDYRSSAAAGQGLPEQAAVSADPSGRYLLFDYDGAAGFYAGLTGNGKFYRLPSYRGGRVVW